MNPPDAISALQAFQSTLTDEVKGKQGVLDALTVALDLLTNGYKADEAARADVANLTDLLANKTAEADTLNTSLDAANAALDEANTVLTTAGLATVEATAVATPDKNV